MSIESPSSVAPLLAWLAARGARFPGAAPRHIPAMGMGLVATKRLQPEVPILFVPRDAWLTRKTAHTTYRPIADAAEEASLFSHSMSRLALLVALERDTPTSFFQPYLSRLGEPTVPYEMTPEVRTAVQGLPLGTWIDDQGAQTESECEGLRAFLRARWPDLAPARAFDLARWRWAYGHVMLRTFSVDVEDEEVWVLVPGMDLCNHADEPNARFFAEADGWYLEASRSILAGEQITIRYGRAKTSSDLLLYYGFVTPRNPNDRLHLKLELSEGDPDRTEKKAAIEVLGLRTDALVGPEGSIPSTFLHAAILWGLDSATFRADQPDVADPGRAIAALERIASSIDRALADFPTTAAHDADEADQASPGGWLRTVISYRLNVKQLHRDAAAGIRTRIDDIATRGWRPVDIVEDDPDGRYGLAMVRVPV